MPDTTGGTSSRLGVLRHPGFQRLWLANLAGGLGAQFATLALSVTAVLALHAGPWQVGLITALGYGANLVLGLPIGVWVDRWRKKLVLVSSDLARAAAVLSVPVAFLAGGLTIAQLMAVAAVVGTANVFFDTAHSGVLPVLVSRDHVSEANARLQTSDTTMSVVGPGIAGQALRVTSGPALYLVTAGMQVVSSVLVALMPVDEPALHPDERDPFWASLGTGLRFVATHPVLRTFMLVNAAINLGAGVFMTIVPIYVLRDLRLAPETYGLVISIGALGGIAGSLVAMTVRRRIGEIRAKVVSTCAIPLAFGLLPLAPVVGSAVVAVASRSSCSGSS